MARYSALCKAHLLSRMRSRELKSETTLWAAAFTLLGIAYFLQFQFVRNETVFRSLRVTLINIAPIVLIGVSVRLIVRRYLLKRPIIGQLGAHLCLAVVFTHLWYLLVLVTASFRLNWLTSGIELLPFYASATLWQLLQGIVIYAAMQGLIYGWWLYERLQQTQSELELARQREPQDSLAATDAVFVKRNGEFRQVDLQDLTHIEANGDHVLLHTKLGQFVSNKALNDYAQKLEDRGFIRVHRSHLVRATAILAAEPTGDGRLSIHLDSGTSIIASRSGTRAFKDYTQQ